MSSQSHLDGQHLRKLYPHIIVNNNFSAKARKSLAPQGAPARKPRSGSATSTTRYTTRSVQKHLTALNTRSTRRKALGQPKEPALAKRTKPPTLTQTHAKKKSPVARSTSMPGTQRQTGLSDSHKRSPITPCRALPVKMTFPLCLGPKDLLFLSDVLGEGQNGQVLLAKYGNLLVACKGRRKRQSHDQYHDCIVRELEFAAKLSACRYINPYISAFRCSARELRFVTDTSCKARRDRSHQPDLLVVQRYYENGDLRTFIQRRKTQLHPIEVLQIAVSLFSALTDAHEVGIGIVDLKLENILVDTVGSGWLTDFGSCVEFNGKSALRLSKLNVGWTKEIAAPEMINRDIFVRQSDVFMASLIIAESVTSSLSSAEFHTGILSRQKDGTVQFCEHDIPPNYKAFLQPLACGLDNNPYNRPSAPDVLRYWEEMRRITFEGSPTASPSLVAGLNIQEQYSSERHDSSSSSRLSTPSTSESGVDDFWSLHSDDDSGPNIQDTPSDGARLDGGKEKKGERRDSSHHDGQLKDGDRSSSDASTLSTISRRSSDVGVDTGEQDNALLGHTISREA